MKIEKAESIYLAEYDVHVEPYLSYEDIQKIVNECMQYRTWEERKEVVQYLTVLYATDITKEEIENLGSTLIEKSGLWSAVSASIKNYDLIAEALGYEESMMKQIELLLDKLPEIAKQAVEKVNK